MVDHVKVINGTRPTAMKRATGCCARWRSTADRTCSGDICFVAAPGGRGIRAAVLWAWGKDAARFRVDAIPPRTGRRVS